MLNISYYDFLFFIQWHLLFYFIYLNKNDQSKNFSNYKKKKKNKQFFKFDFLISIVIPFFL